MSYALVHDRKEVEKFESLFYSKTNDPYERVFLMYISMNKVDGGTAPILQKNVVDQIYSNPLPQVLILTAIVVGVATLSLGLAIVVRIHERYGSIEERELLDAD